MQMSSAHRMPLIGTRSITERSRGWRERFRKQCTDRIQSARQGQIDDRRRQKAIEIAVLEEWENFKRMHEQALEEEGILDLDVDYFLQEDKDDEEYELYNAVTCVNCQMHTLGKVERIILHCPACGFRATEEDHGRKYSR